MKKNAENKTQTITVRLSPSELEKIKRKAMGAGIPISEYIRAAALHSKQGKNKAQPPQNVCRAFQGGGGICPYCGAVLSLSVRFCTSCGAQLKV